MKLPTKESIDHTAMAAILRVKSHQPSVWPCVATRGSAAWRCDPIRRIFGAAPEHAGKSLGDSRQ